jgi:hypothetical protein
MSNIDVTSYAKEVIRRACAANDEAIRANAALKASDAELDTLRAAYDATVRKNQFLEFKLAAAKMELAALKAGQ